MSAKMNGDVHRQASFSTAVILYYTAFYFMMPLYNKSKEKHTSLKEIPTVELLYLNPR